MGLFESKEKKAEKEKRQKAAMQSLFHGGKKMIEYMCTHCGAKLQLGATIGRPSPGQCPRRTVVNGQRQPHRWVVNRRYERK